MNILLLGANGQVGWELQRALAPLGTVNACDRKTADLENPDQLVDVVRSLSPEIIVNAAAYTAVDRAEEESEKAYQINAKAVELLAKEAKRLDALFVHYSTDYVFDGSKSGPYTETDSTNPLSVYGASKLRGEEVVQEICDKYLIFRTSWVYATRGSNFARTMLRLGAEREELKVVSDQFGAPTSAALIADVTALILYRLSRDQQNEEQLYGIYHLAAGGETSWHQYAKFALQQAQDQGFALKVGPENVEAIPTESYPTPAKRPTNSALECGKLARNFGLIMPDWRHHLRQTICEILQA